MSNATYVSLFSSAGLGCHGFNRAAFDCLATAELSERRLDIQRFNAVCNDDASYFQIDLSVKKRQEDLVRHVRQKLVERNDDLDVLIATPPCQGMSVANHKKGNETPRNSLVLASINITALLQPRAFVFENVRSFLSTICVDDKGYSQSIEDAIDTCLGGKYTIYKFVENLASLGAPSSRTRTIVIGVRNDQSDFGPLDLIPDSNPALTLRELIGTLPPLTAMGEFDPLDPLHSFREYDIRMLPWIEATPEGFSAFDNPKPEQRPHQIVLGKYVPNKAANGDKYRRCNWDKIPPCVHTRNDILASQNTVHPRDARVFSVRELMLMMGVPSDFKWFEESIEQVNAMDLDAKRRFMKRHDKNIRECLGEAVPTSFFAAIAEKYQSIRQHDFKSTWAKAISDFERKNPRKSELAAYYTSQNVAQQLAIAAFSQLNKRRPITIIEPSAGTGAFLFSIIKLLRNHAGSRIIVGDVDPKALEIAESLVTSMPEAIKLHFDFQTADFLSDSYPQAKFSLCLGNPPFGKTAKLTTNLFESFIREALNCAEIVSFVVPKSLVNAREFKPLRERLAKCNVPYLFDWGESAFPSVRIETVGFVAKASNLPTETNHQRQITIHSRLLDFEARSEQSYVFDPSYPNWLLYRNPAFDAICQEMELGAFETYRDRSISKKHQVEFSEVHLVKGRNIRPFDPKVGLSGIFVSPNAVPKRLMNYMIKKNVYIAPNLTYFPRLGKLPNRAVADGSAAYMIAPRNLKDAEIEFYSSALFFKFFRVAMNYSTRSLNIDSGSAFFWGIPSKALLREAGRREHPERNIRSLLDFD